MGTYSFCLILSDDTVLSGEMADQIYEAGIDDGLVGACEGTVSIEIDREAESLQSAIVSACQQVKDAGYSWQRVEISRPALDSMMAAE